MVGGVAYRYQDVKRRSLYVSGWKEEELIGIRMVGEGAYKYQDSRRRMAICLTVPIHLFIHLSVYMLSINLSVHPPVQLSLCMSIHPSIYRSVHPYVCLSNQNKNNYKSLKRFSLYCTSSFTESQKVIQATQITAHAQTQAHTGKGTKPPAH